MYLLDTDILIDIQRGNLAAVTWFQGLQELPSIPGFVVMELVQDAHNLQQIRQALKLVAPFLLFGRQKWIVTVLCRILLTTTYPII